MFILTIYIDCGGVRENVCTACFCWSVDRVTEGGMEGAVEDRLSGQRPTQGRGRREEGEARPH